MSELKNIPISKIEVNKGQVEGLPQNPRFIRDERYNKLKQSIQDAPEMLEYRTLMVFPNGGKYVTICGNMRLRAAKDLGYKEMPCFVLDADTDPRKLREYAIKDNVGFGQDDNDLLANEWDMAELTDWGMELPEWNIEDAEEPIDDDDPTFKDVQFVVEVVCKDEAHQNEVFSKLDAQGYEVRFKTK